ncbi:MAG: hypothetical protein CL920_00690 [Deltaproteobacteria bacterium]|nr:hypothetical protein [Deltaproteobacteria bacterium]
MPDIHGIFVYIATYRLICIAPLVDQSKAQVIQGGDGGQSPSEGGSKVTYIWFDWSPFLLQRMVLLPKSKMACYSLCKK